MRIEFTPTDFMRFGSYSHRDHISDTANLRLTEMLGECPVVYSKSINGLWSIDGVGTLKAFLVSADCVEIKKCTHEKMHISLNHLRQGKAECLECGANLKATWIEE